MRPMNFDFDAQVTAALFDNTGAVFALGDGSIRFEDRTRVEAHDGAVHMMDARVSKLSNPKPDITFTYGPTGNHGWAPWTKPELYGVMARHIADHAPAGTDTSAWMPRAR